MESRTIEYQTVAFAALLYDVQRLLKSGALRGISDERENPQALSDFIPLFIKSFPQIIDSSLMLYLFQGLDKAPHSVGGLDPGIVRDSHLQALAYLIDKADTLSSSEGDSGGREQKVGSLTPLASVLERVNRLGDEERLQERHHVVPLGLPADIKKMFPAGFTHYEREELSNHLIGFANDLRCLLDTKMADSLDKTSFDCVLSHLLGILYQYAWCLASDGQGYPDVSLYDRLRTTAAIASCLYFYHSEEETLSEDELRKKGADQFCLAVGDISGIQNYIFDIASIGVGGGIARRLRARSLFVQLCCEVASHLILRRLNLPIGIHMVMNSGGRFYLLLPNTKHANDVIDEIQHVVSEWFQKRLNGELALNLAKVRFGDDGFKAGNNGGGFGTVMKELNEALNLQKQRRFSDVLLSSGRWAENAFTLQGKGTCISCHKFPESEEGLCVHCQRDKKVGAKLVDTGYIAFFESEEGEIPLFGYSVSLMKSVTDNADAKKPYVVMKLNDPDVANLARYPAMSRDLAKYIPLRDDCEVCEREESPIATFECIAKRAQGDDLLGFLKADVDRLGETFIFGLKGEKYSVDTISRITTLSRMLDIFFSGWVEHLNSQEKNIYTIYSGGDDLFLVGPWDGIMKIAEDVREEFGKFTNNPSLTLSAGLVIGHCDYPISTAAEEANDALDRAKKEGRDRITILGRTLTWADWAKVKKEWEGLKDILPQTPSAFLYYLLRFAKMWEKYNHGKGDVLGLRYHPLLAYSMARNVDPKKMPVLYTWTKKILDIRVGDNGQIWLLDNLGLIARLMILSKRRGGGR